MNKPQTPRNLDAALPSVEQFARIALDRQSMADRGRDIDSDPMIKAHFDNRTMDADYARYLESIAA